MCFNFVNVVAKVSEALDQIGAEISIKAKNLFRAKYDEDTHTQSSLSKHV